MRALFLSKSDPEIGSPAAEPGELAMDQWEAEAQRLKSIPTPNITTIIQLTVILLGASSVYTKSTKMIRHDTMKQNTCTLPAGISGQIRIESDQRYMLSVRRNCHDCHTSWPVNCSYLTFLKRALEILGRMSFGMVLTLVRMRTRNRLRNSWHIVLMTRKTNRRKTHQHLPICS